MAFIGLILAIVKVFRFPGLSALWALLTAAAFVVLETLAGNLKPKEIKQSIVNWRSDYFRV